VKRLHQLSRTVALQPDTLIMIYESALSSFMATGELDFFNSKVILNLSQRKRCMEYLKQLVEKDDGGTFALVDGGFSNDFQYITNPCMFLSDSVCYVRLENKRYKDNILILNDRRVKDMFDRFYNDIWTERGDVVISDNYEVLTKVEHYIKTAEYFNEG